MNSLSAKEKAEGWELLFDGKTLNGWHPSSPSPSRTGDGPAQPTTALQNGDAPRQGSNPKPCSADLDKSTAQVLRGSSRWEVVDGLLVPCGEVAGSLNSDKSYQNFVLSFDFRCGEDANSGVYIRSPQESNGYEVQIWKEQFAGYNTGSIVGTAKTVRNFNFEPNLWNHFQIEAQGDHLVVVLNGTTTVDVHDTKVQQGHLRLQYQKFPIEFRNIKLRVNP